MSIDYVYDPIDKAIDSRIKKNNLLHIVFAVCLIVSLCLENAGYSKIKKKVIEIKQFKMHTQKKY